MKTKTLNQSGIAHIALILGVVVLVAIIAGAFKVVQHNRADKNTANTSKNTGSADKESNLANDALSGIPLANGQTGQSTPQQATTSNSSTPTTNNNKKSTSGSTSTSNAIQGSSGATQSNTSGGNTLPASNPPISTSDNGDTPQIALTYPSYWGQTVSGTINITATASDSSGVREVTFRIKRIGYAQAIYTEVDTTAPYSATFNTTTLPNGGSEYTVEAQVFDNMGTGNSASHRINIQN